jgi:hypothetical protein
MRNKCLTLISLIGFAISSWAQSSPSPAPQPSPVPVKPKPCTPSSVVPKRVRIVVPPWLQREINSQAARLGTIVDANGMIADATSKPCPAVAPLQPAPLQPIAPTPSPKPVVTVHCDPFAADPTATPSGSGIATLPDPHHYQAPTQANQFEFDKVEPDLGTGNPPCSAFRMDKATGRYWLPSQPTPADLKTPPAQSQPKQ